MNAKTQRSSDPLVLKLDDFAATLVPTNALRKRRRNVKPQKKMWANWRDCAFPAS